MSPNFKYLLLAVWRSDAHGAKWLLLVGTVYKIILTYTYPAEYLSSR